MGSCRDQLRVGRVGIETAHPLRHHLGVRLLLRARGAARAYRFRIVGVRGVDGVQRTREPTFCHGSSLAPMTAALDRLVSAVEAALDDNSLPDDAARVETFRPAMAALLADPDPIPDDACEPFEGGAVGNL